MILSSNIRSTYLCISLLRPRSLHTSAFVCSLEKSPLFKLRQKTGLAYSLCREALDKHNNDINEAEDWLKAQALAHGLQKATKLRGRSAREGLVCLAIQKHNKLATLLELNCETDFVAKNQIFKDFALSLTEQVASSPLTGDVHQVEGQEFVEESKPSADQLQNIHHQIVPLITKLGENIRVQRVINLHAAKDDTYLFGQVHAKANQKSTDHLDLMTGRFGSIVALRNLARDVETNKKKLTFCGNNLCQHVIGFNPTYIELPSNIRKHLEEAEKQKPVSEVAENNEVEEFSDSEEDHVIKNDRDDWPSMMDQTLIMSDDKTVREFTKENGISIAYFKRFECGESSEA